MIVDVDAAGAPLPHGRYDVCILGGGVAGITLATTLARRRRRVLLLEAGGLEYSDRSQDLYAGRIVGRDYVDPRSARLRYLGGSSNHWSGRCRPLDPEDLAPRPHVDPAGWPIGSGDLAPYLAPACAILELDATFGERDLPGGDDALREVIYHRSPPVRFLDKYLDSMQASEALDVRVHANVTGLEFDGASGRVEAALFRGYHDDAAIHRATADHFVLALGGLENARLLLEIADGSPLAAKDLLGRFFMDHLHYLIGHYVIDPGRTAFSQVLQFVAPSPDFQRRRRIGNCAVRIETFVDRRGFDGSDALAEVRRLVCESTVFRCSHPAVAGSLRAVGEQVPNAQSRVSLSDQRDALGLRRLALDWRLSPLDKATLRTVALELGRHFAHTNIGRIRLDDWVLADDDEVPELDHGGDGTGFHHMGTTRMGRSPADGVVDRNGTAFGVPNLHLAGSSVFRTCGHANPTLTIVQLALRLADHLAPG